MSGETTELEKVVDTQEPSLQARSLAVFGQLRRILARLLKFGLVLFPRSFRPASNKNSHELHPTAYLDALRGYAAWIVYNAHVIPYGWRREEGPLISWPFLGIWFKGPAMVDLFFVISGFALSYGALGHMHNEQPARVLDGLASSVFRRHLRLYLPVIFASFVSMVAIATGIAIKVDKPEVLQPTLWGNFAYWVEATINSCDPFPHVESWFPRRSRVTLTDYMPQFWTIPVEFRGSLVVFMFCLAVCKMTTRARMWCTLLCSSACFWWTTPYGGLFLFGMWLADCRHHRTRLHTDPTLALPLVRQSTAANINSAEALQDDGKDAVVAPKVEPLESWSWALHSLFTQQRSYGLSTSREPLEPTIRQQLHCLILFFLSLWPLTAPERIRDNSPFPYPWIAKTLPPTWYDSQASIHWSYCIGAMMMCYAIDHSPLLQAPLKAPISQYMGELSFGIYIMHNLVRYVVWDPCFVPWQVAHWGKSRMAQVPGWVVMTILVFWAAEVFRRVDVRCVRLTKRLQDALWEH